MTPKPYTSDELDAMVKDAFSRAGIAISMESMKNSEFMLEKGEQLTRMISVALDTFISMHEVNDVRNGMTVITVLAHLLGRTTEMMLEGTNEHEGMREYALGQALIGLVKELNVREGKIKLHPDGTIEKVEKVDGVKH